MSYKVAENQRERDISQRVQRGILTARGNRVRNIADFSPEAITLTQTRRIE
jgi:hypothetical protein